MSIDLPDSILKLLQDQSASPDLSSWNPELCGDISIEIDEQCQWHHNGSPIKRQTLVNLFASILRKESDGHYYLVTPVEKWRIVVKAQPFLIVDFSQAEKDGLDYFAFTTNVGKTYVLDESHPLSLNAETGVPELGLDYGLTARLGRNVFYQLVEISEEQGGELKISSAGQGYSLGSVS